MTSSDSLLSLASGNSSRGLSHCSSPEAGVSTGPEERWLEDRQLDWGFGDALGMVWLEFFVFVEV